MKVARIINSGKSKKFRYNDLVVCVDDIPDKPPCAFDNEINTTYVDYPKYSVSIFAQSELRKATKQDIILAKLLGVKIPEELEPW